MIVIGIDPGAMTGIVAIHPTPNSIDLVKHGAVSSLATTRWLEAFLREERDVAVVAEKFTISTRTVRGTQAGALEALYTLGAVRHICANAEVPLVLQNPSSAKKAVTDTYLRDLGITSVTVGPHERDALRHALLYARTHNLWKGTTA